MKRRSIHQHIHNKEAAATVAVSFSSIVLSIIAFSHHWLHMGILLLLGGSTNMMAALSGVLLLRRVMVSVTLIISFYSVYRLIKQKHAPAWIKVMSSISVLISISFVLYTITAFGW